jgi:hypothetical protein
MARYMTHPAARSLFVGGAVAGTVGAVVFHAFLFVIGRAHFPATYLWIASAVYPNHFGANAIALGIVIHFAISIVAGVSYAYVAQTTGLIGRPWMGGLLFGIVANAIMDLVVYARHLGPLPSTWHAIGIGLLAHVVFFALPVAFVLMRYERVPVPWV